ncbi:Opi1-domain-containing protein [Phanerochaete sordida]|uniref:Opi1-domain-containing protein n=1 Tax=Phanerochaete sordida TaxID=48140 RepID=A0A9P3LCC1_9APHY|nr:Opi1-domain-containing protein [Phanerochaete sordida]
MDTVLEHPDLEDQDESVRIAVRALGDMRNSVHASPTTSFQPTPALSTTSRSSSPSLPEEDQPDFVSRVSTLPLVNTALRAYEQGKASSRVVKYGAEMMESSVKTISRPVIERLPVGQLDEFACRQLDRLDSYRRKQSPERGRRPDPSPDRANGWTSALRDISIVRGRRRDSDREGERDRDVSMARGDEAKATNIPESHSRTPTPGQDERANAEQHQQVVQRSRWQAVLLEAGGIGAAVSEESMRRLKYCLQWLQYATAHIDAQILVLRDFIASLQNSSSTSTALSTTAPLTEHHLQTLTSIRRDVVDTIRQVVDVVSKYAGGALPEPARTRVRQFILCLPQRWAHAASGPLGGTAGTATVNGSAATNGSDGKKDVTSGRGRGRAAPYTYGPGEAGPSPRSRPASRATSPSSLRTHPHGRQAANAAVPTAGAAAQAAQKILTLATESLDMLRAVTSVFKESLDKADAWVERLRVVGLQRQSSSAITSSPPTLPPPSSLALPQPQSMPLDTYRDPLPPIQSTPSSSRAHSPVPSFAQLQLPPLDPALVAASGYAARQQQLNGRRHEHRGPEKEFDALTLSSGSVSAASSLPPSRFTTPRMQPLGLDSDGALGSYLRDGEDIRRPLSSEREVPVKADAVGRMDVDR